MRIMRKYIILAAVIVAIPLISTSVIAANIYVDNTLSSDITNGTYSLANRNNAGSAGNAYRTIKAAVNAMAGGDDIFIRGGTYYEHDIYIAPSKSGTATNWSTMQSYPGEWAIIDGQRQCSGTIAHAVIYNGLFGHEGSSTFANFWIFEKLEITGGGLAGGGEVAAAGIWWVKGPVTVRYCSIHDNLADRGNENPAGFNGCSQQNIVIEYCYFRNNGSILHEVGNDRNICLTGSTEYSSTPYDEKWYVKNNIIRYNYIDCNGGGGIMTKAIQRLTSVRDGSDTSHKTWGDKIYNNIIINAKWGGIYWQQDFVQIYNNIVSMYPNPGAEDWGIATRRQRSEGCDIIYPSIYNNTIIGAGGSSIFHDLDAKHTTTLHYFCVNNISDSCSTGYDYWDISYAHGTSRSGVYYNTATKWPLSFNLSDVTIDRTYFYRSHNTTDHMLVGSVSGGAGTHFSYSTWKTAHPGTDMWYQANQEGGSNKLYRGTSGADKYITIGTHNLGIAGKTISNTGLGGSHPYLSGITIPNYIGATDPSNNGWVATVLGFANVNNLMNKGTIQEPTPDTTPPQKPSGITVNIKP